MKKSKLLLIIGVILIGAMMLGLSGCTKYTCPTYSGVKQTPKQFYKQFR